MKKNIFVVVVVAMLAFLNGCAVFIPPPSVESKTTLVKDMNGAVISTSYERTVSGRSYRDPETALSVAEADLLLSYASGKTSGDKTTITQEQEGLGFIINDRFGKSHLTIKTRGGMTIFASDVPPRYKLEYKLRWGEYVTVWVNGSNTYVTPLRVMPYTDVRTLIRKGGKEEEVKGHWMTQLPE